jgi:hypothetical protein
LTIMKEVKWYTRTHPSSMDVLFRTKCCMLNSIMWKFCKFLDNNLNVTCQWV